MRLDVKMLKFLTFNSILILILKFSYSEDICTLCNCKGNVLDCSIKTLKVVPETLKNGNKSIILFEHNSIIHLHKLPSLKVTYFSFAHNLITQIDDSAFKNLFNLTTLDLSNNYLNSIGLLPNVFKGNYLPEMYEPLPTLKELNLGNNLFHTLHPKVFEHLPNLEKLTLSKNPLKVLSHGIINAISSLPHLKELHLSNTSLKTLPENIFHAPKYLEYLDLSYNQFKESPIQLENTHSLKWLSLNGNPIKYIENFAELPFLQTIHLSKMPELLAIKNRSLSKLPLLEEFYCSDNLKLVKIEKDAFSTRSSHDEEGEIWPPLKILVLNNNGLRYIESHLVNRWESLKIINLQQNPWMCDCENQWLVSTLTPVIKKISPETLSSFQCSGPRNKKYVAIVKLSNETLPCHQIGKTLNTKQFFFGIAILLIIAIPSVFVAFLYYSKAANYCVKFQPQYELYEYSKLCDGNIPIECTSLHF